MKNILILIAFTLFTLNAFSANLCHTLGDEGELKTIYTKRIESGVTFNSWEIHKIMMYIHHDEIAYTDGGERMNFWDVRRRFSNSYDELNLQLLRDQNSGRLFVYVWSYPGDNEYGVYLTTAGRVLAEIQDGDLVIDGDYCP